MDEAKAAADKLAQGTTFEALAAERGLEGQRHRSRHGREVGGGRSRRRGRRLRAQSRRGQRAGPGPVRHRHRQGREHRGRQDAAVRGGRRPNSSATSQNERAKNEITNVQEKIEDERLGGATLADAARKFNLTPRIIEASTAPARTPRATPSPTCRRTSTCWRRPSAPKSRGENEPLRVPSNGGYVWFDVDGITPARDRPLDEVKDQVVARWRDDEIATRLKAKADRDAGQDQGRHVVRATSPRPTSSRSNGGRASSAAAPTPGLSAAAVDRGFQDAAGRRRQRRGREPDRADRVPRHRDQGAAARSAGSPRPSASTTRCKTALAEDLLAQYIARLQNDIGVTINQSALNQVTGGSTQNDRN